MKDKTVARAFGKALRTARTARGLTQEALAAEAEMDRTYPSLLERGLREPTLDVFLRLAKALRMSPSQFIADTLARLPPQYTARWLTEVGAVAPPPDATRLRRAA